tara:strand:- start:659 stop:904 length:246 start_codon:yes stop_codon:yes gene_type:complete
VNSLKVLVLGLLFLPATSMAVDTNEDEDLRTKMSFDGVNVDGQYQMDQEAVVTVEDDKVLDALFGVRKNYLDRIQKDSKKN